MSGEYSITRFVISRPDRSFIAKKIQKKVHVDVLTKERGVYIDISCHR